MASDFQTILQSLKRHGATEPTDGQLLSNFIDEQSETAFAELIHRHGAMVFGSARRLLGSATDAEDVYQSAFLLLARKARQLRRERSLAGWLYGVTRRISADLRKQQRRRLRREQWVSEQHQESARSSADETIMQQEVLQFLHVEMARLTPVLREPLVLQCLEGLSHQQIAARLGLPMGTVASRLNRAKDMLKTRLVKRGVAPVMIVALMSGVAQAHVKPVLVSFAAARIALLQTTSLTPFLSPGALALFQGEVRMLWFKQLQLTAAAILIGGLTLVSIAGLPSATVADAPSIGASHQVKTVAIPTMDDELAKLQGTWHCVSVVPGGKNQPPPQEAEGMLQVRFRIVGDKLTAMKGGENDKTSIIKLDTISSPKRLELSTEGAGTIIRALYMVEGDVLVFTFQEGKKEFPGSLAATKDLQGAMMVLQKVPLETRSPTLELQPVQALRNKMAAMNNMKQIGLSFHLYADKHSKFPRNITSKNGKALLSWRVALLPYLDENDLYQQFHLDEPWDSEHNQKLMSKMPKVFALSGDDLKGHTTPFQCFIGNGAVFEHNADVHFQDIVDGVSNTIMFVEAAKAVQWTKPEDIDFLPNQPLPQLGGHFGPELHVTMVDGSVRRLPQSIKESTLKALITRAGGEIPALDEEEADKSKKQRNPVK